MALSVMLTVGFLVPLAISVRSQAEVRGIASAQSNARGVATSLAAVAGSTGSIPGLNEAEFILSTFGKDRWVSYTKSKFHHYDTKSSTECH